MEVMLIHTHIRVHVVLYFAKCGFYKSFVDVVYELG